MITRLAAPADALQDISMRSKRLIITWKLFVPKSNIQPKLTDLELLDGANCQLMPIGVEMSKDQSVLKLTAMWTFIAATPDRIADAYCACVGCTTKPFRKPLKC